MIRPSHFHTIFNQVPEIAMYLYKVTFLFQCTPIYDS